MTEVMPDPAIRRATELDCEGHLDLRETVAAEELWIGAQAPTDREEGARRFRDALGSESHLALVADAGGEIVGSLGAEDRRGLISLGMFVAPGWRRRGIGRGLLAECLAWARWREAHKVTLQVWPHNGAAVALYRQYGFVIEGHLRRHYRRRNGELWDAFIMGLQLE